MLITNYYFLGLVACLCQQVFEDLACVTNEDVWRQSFKVVWESLSINVSNISEINVAGVLLS